MFASFCFNKQICDRLFFLSFCGFLCFYSSGCDFVYRMVHKEGAEEKELVGDVLPHESNLAVEEIQSLLKLYGYNPGNVDGILGRRTRDTVERFQRENGLEGSRVVDQATWQKLSVFKNNGFVVDNKLNVRLVQEVLKKAGFDPGQMDGKFGPKTKSAVLRFQEAHQLKVDGKVGYQTLTKLSLFLKSGK